MSNKLLIFRNNRKKSGVRSFGRKRLCLKRIRGHGTGKEGGVIRDSCYVMIKIMLLLEIY